ncbi:elongation factor Ts [Patescibacteria group bacterium]
MALDIKKIKKVREATGASMVRVKDVLDELKGNEDKAIKKLQKEMGKKMAKRADRATGQGLLQTYTHHDGRTVSVVELLCETDFVAKNKLFQSVAKDLSLQVASMNPKDVNELVKQDFVKDPGKKVGDLVEEVKAKTGENIQIGRIWRIQLGEK